MFKISVRTLNNPIFMQHLTNLAGRPMPNFKTSYAIYKIHSKVERELKSLNAVYVKEFRPLLRENSDIPLEGMEETYSKKMEEFLGTTVEIARNKVKLSELANSGIAPLTMSVLEEIFEDDMDLGEVSASEPESLKP